MKQHYPKQRGQRYSWPFMAMERGDFFLVPYLRENSVRSMASQLSAGESPRIFTVMKFLDGFKCTRIA